MHCILPTFVCLANGQPPFFAVFVHTSFIALLVPTVVARKPAFIAVFVPTLLQGDLMYYYICPFFASMKSSLIALFVPTFAFRMDFRIGVFMPTFVS